MRYLLLIAALLLVGCSGENLEEMEPEELYQAWLAAQSECRGTDGMDCYVELGKKYHGPCYDPWRACYMALEDTADTSCDYWVREKTWSECRSD